MVAVDGEVAASENFSNVLLDLAVLRSLSIKVVLVHGASHQIEKLAAERNAAVSNSDGITETVSFRLLPSIQSPGTPRQFVRLRVTTP